MESTSGQPSDMPVERIREAEAAVEARDKEVTFGHTVSGAEGRWTGDRGYVSRNDNMGNSGHTAHMRDIGRGEAMTEIQAM